MGKRNDKGRRAAAQATPTLAEALARLREVLDNPRKSGILVKQILDAHGNTGVEALLDLVNDTALGLEELANLSQHLVAAGSEVTAAILRAWSGWSIRTRLAILAQRIPEDFLPHCLELASSGEPLLRFIGCMRLVGFNRPEAGEALLDLAVEIGLPGEERDFARSLVVIVYRSHGAAAFPSLWSADETRYNRFRHLLATAKVGTDQTPVSAKGHLALVLPYLADPEPDRRMRAVELAIPERVPVETWERLLQDPEVEVRRAAAAYAPPDPALQERLLALLSEDPDEEVRLSISDREDLPPSEFVPRLVALLSDSGLSIVTRHLIAWDLVGRLKAGWTIPDLEQAIACLLQDEDFRLREAGYELQQELGQETHPAPLDATLLDLLALPAESSANPQAAVVERLAAGGPAVLRPLMEAATGILFAGPSEVAKTAVLRKLGRAAVLPALTELVRGPDEGLAAEAAAALGALAPDDEAWQALLRLWEGEGRPEIMLSLLRGAEAWPAWRAGVLYLGVIHSDRPLGVRRTAIELATEKEVPGLADLALRLLVSRTCPDLVENLYDALVEHWCAGVMPEETVERWYQSPDELTVDILARLEEEAERRDQEEGGGEEGE